MSGLCPRAHALERVPGLPLGLAQLVAPGDRWEGGGIHLSPDSGFIGGDTLRLWESTPAKPGKMARAVPSHNAGNIT